VLEEAEVALMRREGRSLRPPIFPGNISCLAVIMGETERFKAQSGLLSIRKDPDLQHEISGVLEVPVQITNQG
jgi:hypothetical protein